MKAVFYNTVFVDGGGPAEFMPEFDSENWLLQCHEWIDRQFELWVHGVAVIRYGGHIIARRSR